MRSRSRANFRLDIIERSRQRSDHSLVAYPQTTLSEQSSRSHSH